MRRPTPATGLIGALALFLLASPARAGLVTIRFEGVVSTRVPVGEAVIDDFDLLPDISPGDPFSGSYTYDDSVAPQAHPHCGECRSAYYSFEGISAASIALEIGGAAFFFDESSQPTPDPLGLAGLSASLGTGPVLDETYDHYQVAWSGSYTQDSDKRIREDLIQLALWFPSGTLIPDPLPGSLITTDSLIVPDLSLRVAPPGLEGLPDFVLVRRSEETPLRIELVNGRPVVIAGTFTQSQILGRVTSLTLVPEAAVPSLLGLSVLLVIVRRV